MTILSDIFITTKDRPVLLDKCLTSLRKCTKRDSYRLTIVCDGYDDYVRDVLDKNFDLISYTLTNSCNRGLGPSINMALAHIDSLKRWDNVDEFSPLTTYVQDDVLFSDDWLQKLSSKFLQLASPLKLGFASGVECIEHPMKKNLGNGMILKDWIRATCMMSFHQFWMSMWPIQRIDPETGRERGKPNDGLGSGVDWWFIRNHPNSVCRTGKTNLVIPGLLQHAGYSKSTWLKRDLPESEEDKEKIKGNI